MPLIDYSDDKIKAYFNNKPHYNLYELKSMEDIFNIDNGSLAKYVVEKLNNCLLMTEGYYCSYENKNYIFITNSNDLYHEYAHMYYNETLSKIRSLNSKKACYDYLSYVNFVDEFIAEYTSAKILKYSSKLSIYVFNIKKHKMKKADLSYYLGGFCGAEIGGVNDYFKKLALNIFEKIIFDENNNIVDIKIDEIIDIIGTIKFEKFFDNF